MTKPIEPIVERQIEYLLVTRKAADFLLAHPERYKFIEFLVPSLEGDECGCFWGWIGHFAGIEAGTTISRVSGRFDKNTVDLYNKLEEAEAGWLWIIQPEKAITIFHSLAHQGLL